MGDSTILWVVKHIVGIEIYDGVFLYSLGDSYIVWGILI